MHDVKVWRPLVYTVHLPATVVFWAVPLILFFKNYTTYLFDYYHYQATVFLPEDGRRREQNKCPLRWLYCHGTARGNGQSCSRSRGRFTSNVHGARKKVYGRGRRGWCRKIMIISVHFWSGCPGFPIGSISQFYLSRSAYVSLPTKTTQCQFKKKKKKRRRWLKCISIIHQPGQMYIFAHTFLLVGHFNTVLYRYYWIYCLPFCIECPFIIEKNDTFCAIWNFNVIKMLLFALIFTF